ncbi:unnamed protein product [Absidia cylindrospora]
MYIYAGKDEQGNTVSDLFMVNLNNPPYTPHPILSGSQSNSTTTNSPMVLLKSQHFCEAVCGKLLVFGRYINNGSKNTYHTNNSNALSNGGCDGNSRIMAATGTTASSAIQNNNTSNINNNNNAPESMYGLWMLDLDTLEWERQDCDANFDVGGWNYFTVITENIRPNGSPSNDEQSQVALNSLLFLGNTQMYRPQGYDHFRDALVINGESLGLYDIPPRQCANEFGQLLNNPELSDFVITSIEGQELYVHQVILITRWPHFRNMYKSGMMEAQQGRMEISEPYPVVLAFLRYLYTDHLDMDVPGDVVCDILVLANMYLLHRLKKICCQRLHQRYLTIDTCTTIFEKAIMTEEVGLKLLALDFMFNHYGAILKADLLHQMSNFARLEFLECIPDESVLQIGRSRLLAVNNNNTATSNNRMIQLSSTTPAITSISASPFSTSSSVGQHPPQHYSQSQSPSAPLQQMNTSPNSNNDGGTRINYSTIANHLPPSIPNTASTGNMMASVARHQRLSSSNGMVMGV